MRAKDQCPSCFQPVAPTDFLCPHCELILDPSQVPAGPTTEVSVVRRMLEAPQRGVPKARPDTRPPKAPAAQGLEGPTKVLHLGPELAGVPVVVATLARKGQQLSELEAWVVSLIDGLHDAGALAKKAGLRELELRVVLRTLVDKQIIDFADEPLSDADLGLPEVLGTLQLEEPAAALPVPPSYGANVDRRDGRFVAPPSRAVSDPAPAPVPVPVPVPARVTEAPAPPFAQALPEAAPPPARTQALATGPRAAASRPAAKDAPPVLSPSQQPARAVSRHDAAPTYPVRTGAPPAPAPMPAHEEPRAERTDPRIAYSGPANRKVLDALKKVKRADASSAPSPPKPAEPPQPFADVLARDTLQVALRMEQGGRLDEAIRFLEKSIAQSPDAASLYNRLGIILMRERADHRRAEVLIRKAMELAPENTVYATNLRQVLSSQALRSQR